MVLVTKTSKQAKLSVLLNSMASTRITEKASEEEKESHYNDYKHPILSQPREGNQWANRLEFFQGFWCPTTRIQPTKKFQELFEAKDSDVVVASIPKSGTTWLKALTFAILHRHQFSPSFENHPLLTSNPHELVPYFELDIYDDTNSQVPLIQLSTMTERRLFATHIPFPSLTKSVKDTNCKIIYICRNPFDIFVSILIFANKSLQLRSLPALNKEETFEKYCKGISPFGPFWDHMLGYLNESNTRANKVLFLKYENLKEDINFHVERIAEFLGSPFTPQEKSNRVVENIIELCSFEKMKDYKTNKFGIIHQNIEKKSFFRKGEMGDWVNHFSPLMVEKLSKIIEEKLSGSLLSFKMCP